MLDLQPRLPEHDSQHGQRRQRPRGDREQDLREKHLLREGSPVRAGSDTNFGDGHSDAAMDQVLRFGTTA